MDKRIFEFRKTNHFLYSQWQRKIADTDLKRILPFIHPDKELKSVAIIKPTFFERRNLFGGKEECLILIIKQTLLITIYWCFDPNYLFKTEKKVRFLTLK
jgi:hypothetical protein